MFVFSYRLLFLLNLLSLLGRSRQRAEIQRFRCSKKKKWPTSHNMRELKNPFVCGVILLELCANVIVSAAARRSISGGGGGAPPGQNNLRRGQRGAAWAAKNFF